jgi:hypothetical protein
MYYGMLSRMASKNPALRDGLREVKEFTSKRSARAKQAQAARRARGDIQAGEELVAKGRARMSSATGATSSTSAVPAQDNGAAPPVQYGHSRRPAIA